MSMVARSLTEDAGPRRTERASIASWLAALGLNPGQTLAGFALTRVDRPRGPAVALTFTGDGATVIVGLAMSDPARRVPARTRSLDVFHKTVDAGLTARATALVRAVATAIAPHDPGGLSLP